MLSRTGALPNKAKKNSIVDLCVNKNSVYLHKNLFFILCNYIRVCRGFLSTNSKKGNMKLSLFLVAALVLCAVRCQVTSVEQFCHDQKHVCPMGQLYIYGGCYGNCPAGYTMELACLCRNTPYQEPSISMPLNSDGSCPYGFVRIYSACYTQCQNGATRVGPTLCQKPDIHDCVLYGLKGLPCEGNPGMYDIYGGLCLAGKCPAGWWRSSLCTCSPK